jgi:hypothetical protein
MPALGTGAFARQLRSLEDAELAAFVADLWAARGFETGIEGTVVVAERPSGVEPERIQCGRRAPEPETDIDTVIDRSSTGPADRASVRVLGPADLRGMLLYAIDRETADRLVREHFGRPLVGRVPDTSLVHRLPGSPTRTLLAGGLVIVLAIGLALGASAGALTFGASDRTPTPAPVTSTTTPDPGGDPPAGGGDLFRYPPGIGSSGVTDPGALAAAHRSALAGATWDLRLAHDGSLDLIHPYREWTSSEQRVVREDHTRYRYQVTAREPAANGSVITVTYIDFGDGTANYRRLIGLHGHTFVRTRLPAADRPGVFAAVSAAYVHRYLSTTGSRVETIRAGATTRQRVVATGTPTAMARTVANYTAVATVDRNGVVHRLTVEYTLLERVPEPTPNGIATPYESPEDVPTEVVGTVRFEMELTDLEETTLSDPGWYETAVNATNGTDLPPWPNDPAI